MALAAWPSNKECKWLNLSINIKCWFAWIALLKLSPKFCHWVTSPRNFGNASLGSFALGWLDIKLAFVLKLVNDWEPLPEAGLSDDCITPAWEVEGASKDWIPPQAAQTHVAREGCNVIYITYVTRRCRVTGDRWKYKRLCMRNILLRSANAK